MLKVLLVDDEPIFRMGLRSGIQWEEVGCKIVGEAKNGEEALLRIEEKKPDLVFLDIKMPKMDGIEVLKKMKDRDSKPKFIVLSCFNEYEYVRQAMKLGACDYLFKPLMEGKDIAAVVREITKDMDDTKEEDLSAQVNLLLEGLLTEPDSVVEKTDKIQTLCPALGKVPYFVLAVMIPGRMCNRRKKEALLMLCKNVLIRCFDDEPPPFFCEKAREPYTLQAASGSEPILYGLFFYHSTKDYALFSERKALWKRIKEHVEVPVWIGCSKCMHDKMDLRKAFEQSETALQMHFFSCHSRPAEEFLEFQSEFSENNDLSVIYKRELEIISDAFGKYQLDTIKDTLTEISCSIIARRLFSIKDFPHMLADSIMNNIRLYQCRDLMEKLIMEEYDVISKLYHQETMEDTCSYYLKLVEKIFSLMHRTMCGQSHSDTIKNVVEFMKEHYSEKIFLSDIAEKAGMSEKYFCKLFKEETGETFVSYLTDIRIRAAERMLVQANMKTYEVAEQTGFGDYHHFCKTFKRITGKTPTEVRMKQP